MSAHGWDFFAGWVAGCLWMLVSRRAVAAYEARMGETVGESGRPAGSVSPGGEDATEEGA